MKTVLKLLLLLAITAYMIFALVRFSAGGDTSQCTTLNMAITDSAYANFVTAADVESILQKAGLYPVGMPMDSISGKRIVDTLKKDAFIKDAVCYKTPGGYVNVIITQRLPLLRIMADNGDDYYIDDKGFRMNPRGYEADLAVATGHISEAYAKKYLVPLGLELRDDRFWDNQIEQINVDSSQKMQIVTRVGGHVVQLGRPEKIPVKLRNLRAFYEKVLPTVGWNRYKAISVEYENQVICKK